MSVHSPVLLKEMLAALAPRDGGRYLDGTFGAGGYSRAILEEADCSLYAIDRDPDALPRAAPLKDRFGDRFTILHGCFGDMDHLLAGIGVDRLDGVVLDIGVSSPQIDTAERGFSFRMDGPLDMRMGIDGETAADIVNTWDEDKLSRLIRVYGEEKRSRAVARAIVETRAEKPFETTLELANLVRSVVRKAKDGIDPATRTFQALRIQVNDELGELDRGLRAAESLLKPGGRLVVVAFHSLEDKAVKAFLTTRCGGTGVSRHMPGPSPDLPEPSFQQKSRKAIQASDSENAENPRARSARLRWALRTEAGPFLEMRDTRKPRGRR